MLIANAMFLICRVNFCTSNIVDGPIADKCINAMYMPKAVGPALLNVRLYIQHQPLKSLALLKNTNMAPPCGANQSVYCLFASGPPTPSPHYFLPQILPLLPLCLVLS